MRRCGGLYACSPGASTIDSRGRSRECCVFKRSRFCRRCYALEVVARVRLVGADTGNDLTTFAV